jgi:hypothetical protein
MGVSVAEAACSMFLPMLAAAGATVKHYSA